VQVFTCPLWYWLLAGMGWLHRDHYLNSIILSARLQRPDSLEST
jgi:hypothetical protein